MLTPNYTIEDTPGRSGKIVWSKRVWPLFIVCSEPQIVPFHSQPVIRSFNPYFMQAHAFTLGYKGLNYSVSWSK